MTDNLFASPLCVCACVCMSIVAVLPRELWLSRHFRDPLGGPSTRYYVALALLHLQTHDMDRVEADVKAALQLDYQVSIQFTASSLAFSLTSYQQHHHLQLRAGDGLMSHGCYRSFFTSQTHGSVSIVFARWHQLQRNGRPSRWDTSKRL